MFCLPKETVLRSRIFVIIDLNITQICFMIEISQKWYILNEDWYLVCFPVFCVCFVCLKSIQICFFLGSRMFVICYKSKYSSVMFYEWRFLEMVHPGSALMTGMFSRILCMLFLSKEQPHMFFPYQNPSAKAAFHQNIPIVIILIFLFQILCYIYSELPGDVEIYFRFFKKNSTSIRGVEDDGCTSHVLDDLLFFRAF